MTLSDIDAAIESVLNGGQRVVINGNTYERANLADLWALRKAVAAEEKRAASSSVPGGGGLLLGDFSGVRQ